MGSEGQRAGLADAEAWVASRCRPLAGEMAGVAEAVGRVLTNAVVAGSDLPPFDRAAWDGYALRAEETAGASAYNPLPVTATRVAAGDEGCRTRRRGGAGRGRDGRRRAARGGRAGSLRHRARARGAPSCGAGNVALSAGGCCGTMSGLLAAVGVESLRWCGDRGCE